MDFARHWNHAHTEGSASQIVKIDATCANILSFKMPAPIDWFENRGDRLPVFAGNGANDRNRDRRNKDSCTRTILQLILLLMFLHAYILTERTNIHVVDIQRHIHGMAYAWNATMPLLVNATLHHA
jgi:hypothetical protein